MNPPKATGQVVPEPEQRKEVCAAAAEALKAALAQLPCYDKVRVPSNATNDAKLRECVLKWERVRKGASVASDRVCAFRVCARAQVGGCGRAGKCCVSDSACLERVVRIDVSIDLGPGLSSPAGASLH
eukprot:179597-Rhodomonas_salina.2